MSQRLVLLVTAGGRLCALPLDGVREIMRPRPTEPFAGAFDLVEGIAMIRGEPTPVLDLARLLGAAEAPPPARFVTLRVNERTAALAVTSVTGVRPLAPEALEDMPPLLRGSRSEHIEGLSRLDAELLFVLRSARLVPDEVWAALDAAGGRS